MNLRRLVRSQHGITLVMAVGVLGILSFTGATLIYYSTTNARSAEYSNDNTGAYHLAEAGMNEMMAILSRPGNNPLTPTLLPQTTTTYPEGTVTWSGTYDSLNFIWNLTSTGAMKSPTGSADVRRTLTAKVPISAALAQPVQNPSWNYVFAFRTGNVCDETLTNTVEMRSALWVMGNLCLANGATITGSPLIVKGNYDAAQPENMTGTPEQPIAEAHIVGSCQWYNQPWHTVCSSDDRIYATILDQTPPAIQPPVVDWDGWYNNAIPGPKWDCTTKSGTVPVFDNNTVRDNSLNTTLFNLTPSTASYTCRYGASPNSIGELRWDHVAKVLNVRGTIFIDGSAKVETPGVNPAMVTYDGLATLYLSGNFSMANKTKLCAVAATSTSCDDAGWNPNNENFTVVAGGNGGVTGVASGNSIQLANEVRWQGALYATNQIQIGNLSDVEGPMIGSQIILGSGVELASFGTIASGPAGMPGNEAVYAQPNAPELYAG